MAMDYHSINNTDIAPTIMSWGLKLDPAQKYSFMCKYVHRKEKYLLQDVMHRDFEWGEDNAARE